MNNKTFVLGIFILTSITVSCGEKDSYVAFQEAHHYFIKNTIPNEDLKNMKIESQVVFDSIFGMATVMGGNGKPTEIDFSKQFVLAVINNSTDVSTELAPISLKLGDRGQLLFEYQVKLGEHLGWEMRPYLIVVVDKAYTKREVVYNKSLLKKGGK